MKYVIIVLSGILGWALGSYHSFSTFDGSLRAWLSLGVPFLLCAPIWVILVIWQIKEDRMDKAIHQANGINPR